jgi:hypothetical protein
MAEERHTSITVYADKLTLDEFESMLGPDFMDDSAWEVETGLWVESGERRLRWSARHYSWVDDRLQGKVEELIEIRADVTRIETRTANYDANPDDAVKASITVREHGTVHFAQALVPNDTLDRIASIPVIRHTAGDAAAWLAVGELLNLISEGSNL